MSQIYLPKPYKRPGIFGDPNLLIENYRYYCDRIKQFYKQFNIEDDEKYQQYSSLLSEAEREQFLCDIMTEKRNNKIDSILL